MEGRQLTSKQELRTMNFGFCIKHKYKYAIEECDKYKYKYKHKYKYAIGECDKYKYKYKHKYANAIKECGRKASKILLGGHWSSTRTVLWEKSKHKHKSKYKHEHKI